MPAVKDVGEPCAGEPHARFDGGRWKRSGTTHGDGLSPGGKPRDYGSGPTDRHRHRASALPDRHRPASTGSRLDGRFVSDVGDRPAAGADQLDGSVSPYGRRLGETPSLLWFHGRRVAGPERHPVRSHPHGVRTLIWPEAMMASKRSQRRQAQVQRRKHGRTSNRSVPAGRRRRSDERVQPVLPGQAGPRGWLAGSARDAVGPSGVPARGVPHGDRDDS
jgi:hypothetical protein